jgi:hypothetical protein
LAFLTDENQAAASGQAALLGVGNFKVMLVRGNAAGDNSILSPGSEKDITEVSGTSSPGSIPGRGTTSERRPSARWIISANIFYDLTIATARISEDLPTQELEPKTKKERSVRP